MAQYGHFLIVGLAIEHIQPRRLIGRCGVPHFYPPSNNHGFVLLEALVAMSLIAGLGIDAFEAYQGLVLCYGKTQEERRQPRLESDQHKVQLLEKGGIGELARMPRGNAPLPNPRRSTAKGQRSNIGKAGST